MIRGYKAVIDWDRLENAYVSAIIELKVTPKAGLGFEDVAAKVMKYPEVESVYLMSGVYDLSVVVKAKTFQDVAKFVAKELSTIDSVTSTATHFVLRRYKEMDVALLGSGKDERGSYWLCWITRSCYPRPFWISSRRESENFLILPIRWRT
jgi:DNA-binding Lrp family transcriptional regulator